MKQTLPMILQWDEAFDLGSDTLTGLNDADDTPPFAPTAKLGKLSLKRDRPELSDADRARLQAAMRAASDNRTRRSRNPTAMRPRRADAANAIDRFRRPVHPCS
jgi:hypothetical protein